MEDPLKQGRVQVVFPNVPDLPSTWIPVASFMTGASRGGFFMPEIGDEAIVAFEFGDFDHPIIVGFVWNGQDTPPMDEDSTKVRRLRTVSGHEIVFDDRPGEEKVVINSKGGHSITLDDKSGAAFIEIKTTGGLSVKLDDASQTITIQAATKVTVEATTIELGAGAVQPAVLGNSLQAYLTSLVSIFNAHMHPGQLAAGILPVTPMVPVAQMPSPTGLLSNKVKEV
ncbi:MAG: phage tail protein [Acidobacteria bacterium]|nr:MAG: phage tail protein [Acidobacteriota bacterium]